jgi:hypothetical protein
MEQVFKKTVHSLRGSDVCRHKFFNAGNCLRKQTSTAKLSSDDDDRNSECTCIHEIRCAGTESVANMLKNRADTSSYEWSVVAGSREVGRYL